ncbi:uncharacterized protein LOC142174629 [Nicotiana tabacum]|uniref:Uncharacterized protein LOC142174629 n=1 Tax=Nicotiana tabacum TaxID=4097 RepID=A0AC58TH55_TOBAC
MRLNNNQEDESQLNQDNSHPNQTTRGTSQQAGIDYNHPLFLHPSDVSGIQIISFQLTGIENYSVWYCSMRVALLGRNKLGLVDGSCRKENFPATLWNHWERVNAIVLSWIISVNSSLLGSIMYASNAQTVWDDLYERFYKVDDARTFNLHKEIATLTQGTSSVFVYYSNLKDMWEEFEALISVPGCDCSRSRDFVVYLQKLKVYQFLMGLNESYSQARSQILMRRPLPTVNQAYLMVISDESQKAVTATSGILGANPAITTENYDIAMYTKNMGNQRYKRNYNVQCDFCKLRGHSKENCFKIVGYPPDFKFKKKGPVSYNSGTRGTGGPSAYNVLAEILHHQPKVNSIETYLQASQMTNGQNMGHTDNSHSMPQIGAFTKDQYEQILQILNKTNTEGNNNNSTANIASMSTALLVSNCPKEWIIDTGATNHMVSDINMLNQDPIVENTNPKRVCLPNCEISNVTHTGASSISARRSLQWEGEVDCLLVKEVLSAEDISPCHQRFGHVTLSVLRKMVQNKTESIAEPANTQVYEADYTDINAEEVSNSNSQAIPESATANLQQDHSITSLPTASVDNQQNQQNNTTRRSGREKHPPIWMKDFVSLNVHHDVNYPISNYLSYENISPKYQAYISTFSTTTEPNSYAEAVRDPRWVDAIKSEIEALENNNTWEVVSLLEGKIIIGCKWIYKIKYKATGEIERFKARLVAKGYS